MGFKKFFLITTGSIALSTAIVIWAYNAGYSGGATNTKRAVEKHSPTTTESTSSPTPTPTPQPQVKGQTTNQKPPQVVNTYSSAPTPTPQPTLATVPVVLKNGTTVYCLPSGVDAVKDADSIYHTGFEKYLECVDRTSKEAVDCRQFCADSLNQDTDMCIRNLGGVDDSDFCRERQSRAEKCYEDCSTTKASWEPLCKFYYTQQYDNLKNLIEIYCSN